MDRLLRVLGLYLETWTPMFVGVGLLLAVVFAIYVAIWGIRTLAALAPAATAASSRQGPGSRRRSLDLAIGILREPPTAETEGLREWAIAVLNDCLEDGVKLSSRAQEELRLRALPAPARPRHRSA